MAKACSLIDRLGGNLIVARDLSKRARKPLTHSAVAMWKQRNKVPHFWQPFLAQMALENGCKVTVRPTLATASLGA